MTEWQTATELVALMGLPGVGPAKALAIARGSSDSTPEDPDNALPELLRQASDLVGECQSKGIDVVGFFDDEFPPSLRTIRQAPAVIYVRGSKEWPHLARSLAVVGTRDPTSFGQTATSQLTDAAAGSGFAIVSGLALGVDAIAHERALAKGALTIAVLGCGLDSVSPRQNSDLATRIIENGGSLVSEQPLGIPPSSRTLVARNRLQSGLAQSILIGQTGIRGGTLHTVRFAAEQGRRIYCPLPHSDSEKSAGLDLLLNRPARDLPDLLPAWKGHQRLADRLGEMPLAHAVSSNSTEEWLADLTKEAASAGSETFGDQLTFDS